MAGEPDHDLAQDRGMILGLGLALRALDAEMRQRFGGGGPFLFGADFTAADVMYAPVVTRFLTWRPEIGAGTRAYCDAVRAHPLVSAWYDAAAAEPAEWLLPDYERTP